MKRLERLTALLSYLQSRRFTPIQELEEKFQISQRTIYRDLKALDESGVPISYEKDKGYFILDGHFLAPLSFNIDEAKSLIFVEQLAKKYTDRDIFNNFSAALEKIKNKLKNHQLADIEVLEKNVLAFIDDNYAQKYVQLAEQACSSKKVLHINYQSIKGVQTQRSIEPIGMTFYSQNWHLIAYCRLRKDYRDFVLSRITKIQITDENMSENRMSLSAYIHRLQELENH